MAVEIERKFLVTGDGWRGAVTQRKRFRQGYLSRAARASVRVRSDGSEARLNVKAAVKGAARAEYEYAIPVADADEILHSLCVDHVVEKTRHWVRHAGRTWEVDVFEAANEGLVVAEIELEAADERFELPAWVGREVTDDIRYYNNELARHPYREWQTDG